MSKKLNKSKTARFNFNSKLTSAAPNISTLLKKSIFLKKITSSFNTNNEENDSARTLNSLFDAPCKQPNKNQIAVSFFKCVFLINFFIFPFIYSIDLYFSLKKFHTSVVTQRKLSF